MFTLEGKQGKTVFVEGATVKIVKEGGIFAAKREKSIPIRNITSVEVKKPGFSLGFIQFSIAGGQARDSSFKITGGAYDALGDENSVVFGDDKNYEVALRIKEYVESYKEPTDATPSPVSTADEILKLKALMDQGIITSEEFNAKKLQLLGN